MKTSKIFRYLLALVLLMLFYPSYAQNETKSMRMYFNTYKQSGGTPSFTLTGDVPTGVTATASDFVWANTYEIFWKRNCSDRILANKSSDERNTNASISFSNMKYEVKEVRWNRMNDIFDNSLTEVFRSLRAFGTVESFTGTKIQGSEATWMVLNKDFTFQKDIFPPNKSNNLALPGLKTLTLNESNSTIIFGSKRKINDNCRFFLKASDDSSSDDWAFQVTYYEPSLSLSGIPSMMFLGQERNFTSGDYTVLHTGAFNFTLESVVSSEPEVISIDANGKMTANNVGSSTITVTMKDGDKVITASKVIDVKTLTPQAGVHYYHRNNSRNAIDFNELNHTDGDYSFSTSDKTDGDFKCLGVLKSATNNDYKVGAKVIDFPMSAPAYTTVTAPFDFKLTNSQSGLNVFDDYGGEIIITEDYNNLTLITNNSASTGSVYKRWKDFFIGTSQSVANNTTLINNSDKASAVKDKTFHMILMSAGDATVTSKTLTTEFYYKIIPSIITYYSYITFNGNGGTITTTNKTQTIANTNGSDGIVGTTPLKEINVAARAGHTFMGWNTEADGTGEFYASKGAFRPSTIETGGEGKGPVTLYAVWQPNTYIVTLNQAGGSGGTTSVTATFDEPLPFGDDVKAPTRYGYTFGGYFTEQNGAGTMYYDNGMIGVKDWDVAADRTLYAKWTANVCKVELRPNGTGAVAGTPYVMVTHNQKFPEEVDGHAVTPPTRPGYIFNGFYLVIDNTKKYFYDKDMKTASCANWPYQADYHVLADWIPKTTTITFDRNGAPDKMDWGGDNGTSSVTATYDANMPDMIPPSRAGYEFMGYFDAKTGGKQYYYTGVKWDKDVEEATLYAHWRAKTVKVIFNYTDPSKNLMAPNDEVPGYTNGTTNHSSLTGTGVTAPMYEDYLFDGWYEKDGKNKTYDAEGNAVEGKYWVKNSDGVLVWQSDNDVNLYPQWIKDATTVEIAEIRLNNYEGDGVTHNYVGVSVSGMTSISNFRGKGYITVDGVNYLTWHKNGNEDNLLSAPLSEAPVWNIDAVEGSPNKVLIYTDTPEGRKYLGNKIENGQVTEDAIGIEDNQPAFYFTIYNERGWICLDDSEGHLFNHILYMKTGNVWEYENTGDNPQYNPIRILAYGSSTSYGDLMSTKVISEIKKKLSTPVVVNGVNTYPYAYNGKVDADLCKGILYVDMGGAASVIEANANELVNFKKEVSDNCLFFMPSNYTNTGLGNNVVSFNGTNYNSLTNLVIKDKVPFFNPYKFHVGNGVKASYHRDYDYKWNSMCLPFPVKLSSDMKYYKLYGSDNLRLAFVSMSDDVIAANTPVACYGNGTFTLENTGIDVPADVDGEKVYVENVDAISCDDIKDYVENKKGTPASQTWNFKGVRFDTYVYGTKNTGTLPNRAEKSLVYYFANDEFRYVNPEGRVKFAPYRAFLQAPDGLFAKSYRLLVFDEEGTTDITDIVDAAEGDGKIYDLQGRRVKTPLKGHVYVVGGKKRLY